MIVESKVKLKTNKLELIYIWNISWDFGTDRIGKQRWLRGIWANVQSHQSQCCLHTQIREEDAVLDQK